MTKKWKGLFLGVLMALLPATAVSASGGNLGDAVVREPARTVLLTDPAGQTGKIAVSASCSYTDAFAELDLINKERESAGLAPLQMDADLLSAAMLRASELSLYFKHVRPSGEMYNTALPEKLFGENIAAGYRTPEAAMTAWMNSEGHRAHILTDWYTAVGLGAVDVNGVRYWVQAFGTGTLNPADPAQYENAPATYDVDVTLLSGPDIPTYQILGEASMEVGADQELTVRINNTFAHTDVKGSVLDLASSDTNVCTITETGAVHAAGAGTAVITARAKGSPQDLATFTITVTDPKPVLAVPNVTSAKRAGTHSIHVTWDPVEGAESYNVYYKGSTTKGWYPAEKGITGTEYTHTSENLVPGVRYRYTVRAVKGDEVSSFSTTGKTAVPLPAAPVFTGIYSVKAGIKLTWEPVEGADGYIIQRRVGSGWKKIRTVTRPGRLAMTDLEPVAGQVVEYRIRAFAKGLNKNVRGPVSEVIRGKK